MTVVLNDDNELIPSRTVTGWQVCIDYRKLKDATQKDHFPLPFIDQMLEHLCGNDYYYFLDGFSGFFQIPITPKDQEKTTSTCPYGTFAYRRTPFGLCNAPASFQRCLPKIFHDMVEDFMEVFMDEFSMFGKSFNCCLANLDRMRCEETNLVLNWEKCHFMIEEVMAEIQTKVTMEEFTIEDQANYYSGITCVTVNGKRAYELKGKFLDDLCDNAFNGTNEEDAVEHINYFLKIVDPINLPNVNHERFSFSTFLISLIGNAVKWFDEFKGSITTWVDLTENNFRKYYPTSRTRNVVGTEAIRDPTNTMFEEWSDDQEGDFDEGFSDVEEANNDDEQETTEIFRIETNLFDYETPLCTEFKEFIFLLKPWSEDGVPYEMCDHICEPFRFKNGKAKWPTFNSNKDGFCNGGELPGMVRVGYMTYFQDYEWYDELTDDSLKDEALKQKAISEKSWGNASQSVINFCSWLKRSFKNFHELDYELLVKVQDYWWEVNDHECFPFYFWKDHIRGPYANFITTHDPYLDINHIFGRDGHASNYNNVQMEQEDKEICDLFDNTTRDASICKVRKFEMIKYLFRQDEEYVAIKECEYDD
ncbi:retrovirus-related pol polyprotein from transposon TNT 1-94 [Tanacetum coccineum]|uniref:Retrovirus-related pol polyprotein from transposon TNT 1-94 n=1 Tax=Tanacetum coccineum TaxID=301880 RepID=A0ABQ5JF06_9ASTR